MYTLLELQAKTFGALKKIGDELNVFPAGDRRYRQTWIDAIAGVNFPLLQLLEVAPAVAAVEQVQPIIETVETSPAVEVEPVQELIKYGRITGYLCRTSPGVEVEQAQESITPAAKNSPAVEVDPVQQPPIESKFDCIVYPRPAQGAIAQAAENSPAVEVEPAQNIINETWTLWEKQHCSWLKNATWCIHQGENKRIEAFLPTSKSVRLEGMKKGAEYCPIWEVSECDYDSSGFPLPVSSSLYAQAAKNTPSVEPVGELLPDCVVCFGDKFIEDSSGRIFNCAHCTEARESQSAIAQTAKKSLNVEAKLTETDAWNPAEFGEVLHAAEPSGQLNLLEWDVSEPPEPDDYEGDIFAFHAAYDRWLLFSELQEIIHTKNPPGITQAPEPIAQNANTRLGIPRNESAGVRYGRSHPAQPDGNHSSTETAGLENQEGDRVLEVAGTFQGHRGRNIPHQPTQLSQSHDSHIEPQSSDEQRPPGRGDGRGGYLELEIGMLVGRRRDRQHLGKILAISKSRRGIWRAKIQPLNKSNFVYFDCEVLIEQRLLYDYEMPPGGFLPSGSTFDKTRGEKFEVYSRKVRSPKATNWTAGELSSLSTFKLKQIARDMEIPSIPGTAGKRSLIRAILAEQAISQEKAAAQRERETGRAIVQKQKSGKKRAVASPLGTQLSLLNVAV